MGIFSIFIPDECLKHYFTVPRELAPCQDTFLKMTCKISPPQNRVQIFVEGALAAFQIMERVWNGPKGTVASISPARNSTDFYRDYDPMIGVGTACVLTIFFISITINSCIRCVIRRWKMHKFYKEFNKNSTEQNDDQKASDQKIETV